MIGAYGVLNTFARFLMKLYLLFWSDWEHFSIRNNNCYPIGRPNNRFQSDGPAVPFLARRRDMFAFPFCHVILRRAAAEAGSLGVRRMTMVSIAANVLGSIGNTPLVQLRKVVPGGSGRVLAKLEWTNPTGSMKDRMAEAAVKGAEASGRLGPGGTVVEYTSGTTGISLALVCAARGYELEIVFSDAFSDEKRHTMQAFGARVTDVRSDNRKITEALIKAMISKAAEISQRPGHWYCDQLNNHDAIAGYLPLRERGRGVECRL